jgi:hypothetical protein
MFMRFPRTAAVTLMGAAAFCATAPAAFADSSGEIEVSPHAVHAGHTVHLSTEDCWRTPVAKVHVDFDGTRHWVWLAHHTSEGLTGWLTVPRDTDPGTYNVEGRCGHHEREIEGSFWVVKHHW